MGVAFIVDGQQEQKIVQRLCEDAPVRRTSLNGRDVAIGAIAKNVASLIRLLKGRYRPVFVVVDRESRRQSSKEMETSIINELIKLGVEVRDLVVSVPDRMLENWIIAGNPVSENGRNILLTSDLNHDGTNGKVKLKKLLKDQNISYYELGNGIELFCNMNMKDAVARSASFCRLYSVLFQYCPKLRYLRK